MTTARVIPVASRALVEGIGPIGIVVDNLDRALELYCGVLDFVLTGRVVHAEDAAGTRVTRALLRLGDELVLLTEYARRGRPVPVDSRSNDLWFQHIALVVSDMAAAYERLRARDVRHVSTRPQRLPDWNPNAGGIEACYFQDRDGHPLELLRFPAGKGAAKWHVAGHRLFLGIDHTAIVVADTERSLRFYRDALGLYLDGASENYGVEQEQLSGVRGARVRITGLRAGSGPGIELLEYRTPRDGRAYLPDSQSNDLWHWQTTLLTQDADATASALRAAGARFLSPRAAPAVARSSIVARDPDGHALEIFAS